MKWIIVGISKRTGRNVYGGGVEIYDDFVEARKMYDLLMDEWNERMGFEWKVMRAEEVDMSAYRSLPYPRFKLGQKIKIRGVVGTVIEIKSSLDQSIYYGVEFHNGDVEYFFEDTETIEAEQEK